MSKVAIIGAGASGLVSVKTCLEEGMVPICFEKTGHIGGLWYFSDEPRTDPTGPGVVYKELFMNSSKELSAYSDFPMPQEYPPYIKRDQMYSYYQSFADHFNLLRHIEFETEVLSIEEADDYSQTGRWKVTVRNASGQQNTTVFDAVMVCTGVHSEAIIPTYPGLDTFKGEIMHSRQVRKGADCAGKNVLVVGSSISAGDMAAITSNHAEKVYISTRSGTWIVPRFLGKNPIDTTLNRRCKNWIPDRIQGDRIQFQVEALYDPTDLGILSPKHVTQKHPILNDNVAMKIRHGNIMVKGAVRSFEGSRVNFTDGSSLTDIDVVIFATGYDVKFPFFKKELISDGYQNLKFYLKIFPPRMAHPTLAFVGFAVPYLAGQNHISEMQARYAVKVIKREVKLPSVADMDKEIEYWMNDIYTHFEGYYPFCFYPANYKDFLAKEIGALPSLARMVLTDPVLAYHYYFGVAYPPCYRLVGPGAKPNAREAFLQCRVNQFSGITASTVRSDAWNKPWSRRNRWLFGTNFFPLYVTVVLLSVATYIYLYLF